MLENRSYIEVLNSPFSSYFLIIKASSVVLHIILYQITKQQLVYSIILVYILIDFSRNFELNSQIKYA